MFTRAFLFPPLALLLALGLGACGDVASPTVAAVVNPTPLQSVRAILDRAAEFPAAGDDLTMYIGKRFDEVDEPVAPTRVSSLGRFSRAD